jgi:hypothetical protein
VSPAGDTAEIIENIRMVVLGLLALHESLKKFDLTRKHNGRTK